jgi:hypothetical protein
MHGIVSFALLFASRATDHIDSIWFGHDEDRRRDEITNEIRRQRSDLHAITAAAQAFQLGRAAPADLITALRR